MIKGHQVNYTKVGVQLVLHRDHSDLPVEERKNYRESEQINKPGGWWLHCWPEIKGAVNVCLHKNLPELVLEKSRTWIRVGDDISVSIYSIDIHDHPTPEACRSPYHPGCLQECLTVPIGWWNDHIDDITERVQRMARTV